MNSLNLKPKPKSFLSKIGLFELSCAAISISVVELAITGVLLKAIVTIVISLFTGYHLVDSQTQWLKDSKFNRFLSREGVIPVIGLAVLTGICLYYLVAPDTANAQFFFKAEETVKTQLGTLMGEGAGNLESIKNIISLVMWTLRFLLLGYLGVNVVRIGGMMRENEDYKEALKTPMLFLILLAISDMIATMILGAATA